MSKGIPNCWRYSWEQLVEALRKVGLKSGDTVLAHVSLGILGIMDGCSNEHQHCEKMHQALREVVGIRGTILVPSYSYSFCNYSEFDAQSTPSTVGPFTEYFRKLPNVIRSDEPIFSIVGEGPRAREYLFNLPHTCFGPGCAYARFVAAKAFVCTIGLGLHYATFRHHIEEMASVPFRFKKRFPGLIRKNGVLQHEVWTYSVSPYAANCHASGHRLEGMLIESGDCKIAPLGRARIMCIRADHYFTKGLLALKADPWLTAQGPPGDPEELEAKRIARSNFEIKTSDLIGTEDWLDALWNIPRDVVSDGYNECLKRFSQLLELRLHRLKTGREMGKLLVPEKWKCSEGSLQREDGTVILSYEDNRRCVASYSVPFEGRIARKELLNHLVTDKNNIDRIPRLSLDHQRKWAFACSEITRNRLMDPYFQIVIKSEFCYSSLQIAEATVPGKRKNGPALVVILNEVSSANLDLTGALAGIEVLQEATQQTNAEFSLRLFIVPAIEWLYALLKSSNEIRQNVTSLVLLSTLGIKLPLRLVTPRGKDIEPAWSAVSKINEIESCKAPSTHVPPTFQFTRALPATIKNAPYAEYGTSFDTPELFSKEHYCKAVCVISDILLNSIKHSKNPFT